MHLAPVRRAIFVVALALAITGMFATLGVIEALEPYDFWFGFVAWILVTIGCLGEHV